MKQNETEFLMKIFEASQEIERAEKEQAAKAAKPKPRVTQVMDRADGYEVFVARLRAILSEVKK